MLRIVTDRIRRAGFAHVARLVVARLVSALSNTKDLEFRVCKCCNRLSLFARLGKSVDAIRCFKCGANLRYELLAEEIRTRHHSFVTSRLIVEMDPGSPLRKLLAGYGSSYLRTFYDSDISSGICASDGAHCQDLQKLTFGDETVDIIVSSDVLEHVPDFHAALSEMHRVLAPEGFHLFTVPISETTRQRARIVNGKIEHLMPPIYHLDPLNPAGVLVFWEFGVDFDRYFQEHGMSLNCVQLDKQGYRVWCAQKHS